MLLTGSFPQGTEASEFFRKCIENWLSRMVDTQDVYHRTGHGQSIGQSVGQLRFSQSGRIECSGK
jgi:hypothetical protein